MQIKDTQKSLSNYISQIMKPRPILSGSEWADKYFELSSESSAITGKWKTYPWQKEILDAMTDNKSKFVTIKKPTRIGYSIMLSIVIAYYIHQRPSNQFHYQPNDDEAKGYAEDSVEPMIRDNSVIKNLVETPSTRGRLKKEKTVKKVYPSGHAEFLGAESDKNFNRRTGRVVSGDEVDAWKREAGNTGDKLATMFRRTSDFWDRKNIIGGKPIGTAYNPDQETDENTSLLDINFHKGTQEYLHLPCPSCNNLHKFEFEDLTWKKDKDENNKTIKHYPEDAHFTCAKCDQKIYDKHKRSIMENCEWIAENPSAYPEHRSFSIWAMVSYSPNVTWVDIVKEFLACKGSRLKLKAFTSEVLGRTWEEDFEKVNIDNYSDRLEEYKAEVPNDVLILTAGADIQKDRIECEVVGWCKDEESYSIEYKIFFGETDKPEVWLEFDTYLNKTFHHDNGGLMKIYCTAVDSGYNTQRVYEFCKPRFSRRIFAIKGSKTVDAPVAPRLASQVSLKSGGKIPLFVVGVNMAKDVIASHIMTTSKGAGYMHYPSGANYDDEYFKQLGSEKKGADNRWIKTRNRNEAFDVRNYNYICLFIAGVDLELLSHRGALMFVQSTPKKKKKIKRDHLDEF